MFLLVIIFIVIILNDKLYLFYQGPLHQLQPSQGATAPTGLQISNSPQPINAPVAMSTPNTPSLPQQQPQPLQPPQPQQQQQQQQQLGKQNKVTPIAKPAGLDPVVILQVFNSLHSIVDRS